MDKAVEVWVRNLEKKKGGWLGHVKIRRRKSPPKPRGPELYSWSTVQIKHYNVLPTAYTLLSSLLVILT